MKTRYSRAALLIITTLAAAAGEADVLSVTASCDSRLVCDFSVTVKHADDGWEHYANRWEVLTPSGVVIATRVLAHPHDNEQPFTRSLRNVTIPDGLSEVIVRAHDSTHKYGGVERRVSLAE